MRTIPELKTYEIKLLKKYCERIIYTFNCFNENTEKEMKHIINICDTELHYRDEHK